MSGNFDEIEEKLRNFILHTPRNKKVYKIGDVVKFLTYHMIYTIGGSVESTRIDSEQFVIRKVKANNKYDIEEIDDVSKIKEDIDGKYLFPKDFEE